jgi:hypothetical protein
LKYFAVVDRIDDHPQAVINNCIGIAVGDFDIMHSRDPCKVVKSNSKFQLIWNLSIRTILEFLRWTGKFLWITTYIVIIRWFWLCCLGGATATT